jgi:hypothetical protein
MKPEDLEKIHTEGRPISKAKFLDLISVLPLLNEKSKQFYEGLEHDGNMEDRESDVEINDNEESDDDDEFWKATDKWLTREERKSLATPGKSRKSSSSSRVTVAESKSNCILFNVVSGLMC